MSDDLELRAGVEPLDQLLDERQHVVAKLAPLYAKYGPGELATHILSAEWRRIAELLRAVAASQAETKAPTEARLENAAKGHKDYLDLLALMTTERAEYFRLTAQLQAIDLRANRGQALLRYVASEPRA